MSFEFFLRISSGVDREGTGSSLLRLSRDSLLFYPKAFESSQSDSAPGRHPFFSRGSPGLGFPPMRRVSACPVWKQKNGNSAPAAGGPPPHPCPNSGLFLCQLMFSKTRL